MMYLTLEEVGLALGLCVQDVQRLAAGKVFPILAVGQDKLRVPRMAVDEYRIAQCSRPSLIVREECSL